VTPPRKGTGRDSTASRQQAKEASEAPCPRCGKPKHAKPGECPMDSWARLQRSRGVVRVGDQAREGE
jgi:hypothetical protein